jgi:hypothetical protein
MHSSQLFNFKEEDVKETEKENTTQTGLAQYTRWSRVKQEEFEFLKAAGVDISYDDNNMDVHIEAYETYNGICIGKITPLNEWRAQQEKAEDEMVERIAGASPSQERQGQEE